MEIFLIIVSLIFLVFGSLFLLSVKSVEKISDLANRLVFSVDERISIWRRPLGIILLALAIFSWYIALAK